MQNALQDTLRLSVVLCAFNEQDWLGNTLRSLLDQDRKADEIIVVNNASTDRTAEVVREFIRVHPQAGIHLVEEPVKGLHHARETGWRSATGDIIVTSDADIRFPRQWLQIYESQFKQHPEIAAMTGPVRYYDALFFINWITWIFEKINQPEGIGRFFTKRYNINGGNSAYRRSALLAVNGYLDKPNGIFEDMHMAAKLQDAGYQIRFVANNGVWHTFRRFNKDGWRGYWRYIFAYTAENVYPDHLADG